MFSVGQKIKINDLTKISYPNWIHSVIGKSATITKVVHKIVLAKELDKDSKSMYRGKYGDKPQYDCYGLYIKFDDDSSLYLTSQFYVD